MGGILNGKEYLDLDVVSSFIAGFIGDSMDSHDQDQAPLKKVTTLNHNTILSLLS